MNRGSISSLLRRLGLLYTFDKLRYRLERSKNEKVNSNFAKANPDVLLPPDYLMYESFQMNYDKYYFGGKETAEWIFGELSKHIDLTNKKVLDWGCGPGRVIRHLPQISNNQTTFFGTDYNKESIDWCTSNIQNVNFNLNTLEAKLPYEDGSIDALYGISIFTHLSKEMHFSWYKELKRVLKVGGVMLFTTQGENFKSILVDEERKQFDQGELIVRGNVKEGHRTYSAFHSDTFLKTLFSDVAILEKIVLSPQGKSYTPQDTWVLIKER